MNEGNFCWECEEKKYLDEVFCIRHLTQRYLKMADIYDNEHNPTYANWYRNKVREIKQIISEHPEELLE